MRLIVTMKKKKAILFLTLLAVEIILLLTDWGMISNGSLSITILQVPVIIVSISLGLPYGLVIGGVFGVGTMIIAAGNSPETLDHLFVNPLVSVLPRLMIAVMAWLTYRLLKKSVDDHTLSSECIASGGAAFVGTMTNTILVALFLCILYPDMVGEAVDLSVYAVTFANIVGANTTIEICICVVAAGVVVPLTKKKQIQEMEIAERPIRKTFHKWLAVFLTAGFIVTLLCSYTMQTMQARENADAQLEAAMTELEDSINSGEDAYVTAALLVSANSTLIAVQDGKILYAANSELIGRDLKEMDISIPETGRDMFIAVVSGITYLCKTLKIGEVTLIGMIKADEIFAGRNETAIILLVVNLFIFIIIFILVSKLLRDNVVKRIYSVNKSLSLIQEGNLDEVVEVRNSEEFSYLSDGINATVSALKITMEQIAVKMNQELEFAREIQQSALPIAEQVAAKRHEYEILGTMDAAKEVGGDFFDYFLIGDDKLGFVIADVSGKGVPAALFMMTSKTLIKNFALGGKSPAEVLSMANDQLCENNEAGMFVTVWLGILNYKTGELQFANAGHNAPLLMRKGHEFVYMDCKTYKRSIMLGFKAGIKYKNNVISLFRGDMLYLYTDGVTEANNEDEEMYGEARLKDLMDKCWDQPTESILKSVRADIDDFAGAAEQFDDITMIVLKVQSSSGTISTEATYENTEKIAEFVEKFFTDEECPRNLVIQMMICLDEIYSNIVKFSCASDIEVTCSVAGDMLYLTFSDNGIPYNPLETKQPESEPPSEDSGIGLYLVRKMMDYTDYKYKDDRNIFTVGKKNSEGKAGW